MYSKKSIPINGVVNCVSEPIAHVEHGMHFYFDGKILTIASDEPLSSSQSMDIFFWSHVVKSTAVEAIIEGSIRPSGEYVAFHVAGRPGTRNHGLCLGVVAYWIICDDLKLEDIGRLRFSGPCIDSFCPMTNIQTKDENGSFSITATTSLENVVDLGLATVEDKKLRLSAEAYWTYDYRRQINFESSLGCEFDSLDYGLMKDAYVNIASAIRFCLGRGNVDLDARLCRITPGGWETVGEFTALHGKMYVPDEYDEHSTMFVRAQNVGAFFGSVVSAFADETFERKTLSESRDDAGIITLSKIIELTSSFEREFRMLFPEGIEHRASTREKHEQVKNAMLEAAKSLPSDSRRIVLRLSERVDEDNLEARIRHACKTLPETVVNVAFENAGINRKNNQLGNKITTVRNDIAHGNKLQHNLGAVREEYKLLNNLVFAMRLLIIDYSP